VRKECSSPDGSAERAILTSLFYLRTCGALRVSCSDLVGKYVYGRSVWGFIQGFEVRGSGDGGFGRARRGDEWGESR
jgi:hypothetical protein